ncbi:MarR family winged helix-turn-helix transcriptional regulator [Tardiphaga sp. 866_E4_N2_1]|uniref:MarR family winged helix-turn-helix transcriptional regulator n=1 Tax=unclassified Tardiphaga TaxID=2631404 RepID=UPI003F28A8D4
MAVMEPASSLDGKTPKALIEALESISLLLGETQEFWAKPLGITVPQWSILAAIKALDEGAGIRVAEVARRLRVDPSFVTAQTKLLEKDNLVHRRQSKDDGRVVLMSLTELASKGMMAVEHRQSSLNAFLFSDFEARELETLLTALRRLEKRYEKASLILALDD